MKACQNNLGLENDLFSETKSIDLHYYVYQYGCNNFGSFDIICVFSATTFRLIDKMDASLLNNIEPVKPVVDYEHHIISNSRVQNVKKNNRIIYIGERHAQ